MQTKGTLGLSSCCYGCKDEGKLLKFSKGDKNLEQGRKEISKVSQWCRISSFALNLTTSPPSKPPCCGWGEIVCFCFVLLLFSFF